MGRLLALTLSMGLLGCQCFVPVYEGRPKRDAGTRKDAGAGVDAGPRCSPAACGAAPAQSLCPFGGDAGFSCLDGECVFECVKGRVCGYDAGTACLECAPGPTTACLTLGCGAATMMGAVESVGPGCQGLFTTVMLVPTGGCQYQVVDATSSAVWGTFTRLSSGEAVGDFTGQGTCLGHALSSQIERWVFSCEGCQFVLRL